MRARGRYEDRNSILHNWSDYGSWSHACLVTALGETMTPEERARLIENVQFAIDNDFGGLDLPMSCAEPLLSDFRRVDLLEKALRPFADAYEHSEHARKSFKGKVGDFPMPCDYIDSNDFVQAKQALGDA